MTFRIFDTHAHYNEEVYDTDREELFADMRAKGVERLTNIAVDLESSRINDTYTKNYDFIYGTVGVFPSDVAELEEEGAEEELEKLLKENPRLVAVGEIGLDYHYEDTDKPLQQKWFAGQMELARRTGRPIVIHSRDAAQDTLLLLKENHAEEIGGVMHCYSYSREMARDFLELGLYFGIGGVLTFKNAKKLREAVEYLPLSALVLETDAPYLTPEPFRGKRNCSSYLTYVAEKIAEVKALTPEEVCEACWENACRLFRLS